MTVKKSLLITLLVFFGLWAFSLYANAEPRLSWGTSSGEVDGYKVYYGLAQTGMTMTKDLGLVNEYFLKDLSLTDGQRYYFGVKAYNDAGESSMSNVVSWVWTVLKPPGPPPNVQIQE